MFQAKWIGKEIKRYEVLDSTNRKARELAGEGAVSGTVVLADGQTAGVGRRGRSWDSQSGQGLYFTILLRPEITTEAAPQLTLIAALAVAKAINLQSDGDKPLAWIKWPNDIVIRGKKVCGILTEMILEGNHMQGIIVGIGINLAERDFPKELIHTATSLEAELGKRPDRDMLLRSILDEFERGYEVFLETEDLRNLRENYHEVFINRGQEVVVHDPSGEYKGIAREITVTGELKIDTEEGCRTVSSGEVSVRGVYGYV